MFRRIALLVAAVAAIFGVSALTAAPAANAATTHIVSPVPTGLAKVCLSVAAANAGVCIHL